MRERAAHRTTAAGGTMEEGDESLEERLARFEVLWEQQSVDAAASVDARINQALEDQRLIVEGLRSVHFQGSHSLSALEVGLNGLRAEVTRVEADSGGNGLHASQRKSRSLCPQKLMLPSKVGQKPETGENGATRSRTTATTPSPA